MSLPPTLIWGLVARGIGLAFWVAFASLTFQVIPIAGAGGLAPVAELMRAMQRDFGVRRYVYFPSLLWLDRSDLTLRALPWLGIVAASYVIAGGPHSAVAFGACYALYLSLDRAVVLVYPWESLLFEAGFWALFLPPLRLLPELDAVSAPLPALAWLYRFLLFRVMFGFGKQKFLGASSSDTGFLHGFFIRQPLPTPLGWLAFKLPMPLHKLALGTMCIIELPLTFGFFFPGNFSVVAAAATAALMVAIWLTGNFGGFNLLTLVLTLSALDTQTAQAFSLSQVFASSQPVSRMFVHGLIVLHTLGGVCSLPFNTWCSFTWTLWPVWLRVRPRFLVWPVVALRALQPLRWLHAYGVFPPRSAPAVRVAPVLEVTWDGQRWDELRHRYSPTEETSAPRFCAPHHPRLEQAIVYESVGLSETSVLRNLSGRWDPYAHGGMSGGQRLVLRVLQGQIDSRLFFEGSLDLRKGPPLAARVRLYMLEATSLRELRLSRRWWRRTLIGPHLPPTQLAQATVVERVPPPELWHFEDLVWLRRSRLAPMLARARRGDPEPHRLVLLDAEGLDEADVERFWTELLPRIPTRLRSDWTDVRATVEALRARFTPDELYRCERLLGRYTACLAARCEPIFLEHGITAILGLAQSSLPAATHYHLGLLTHHIIGQGRDCYDRIFADPTKAADELAHMTFCSGALLQAIFRYETLVQQSQKYRLLETHVSHLGRPAPGPRMKRIVDAGHEVARRIFGAVDMVEFLRGQLAGPNDVLDIPERWPRFALAPDKSIERVPEHPTEREPVTPERA